jgi:hypothetical protein
MNPVSGAPPRWRASLFNLWATSDSEAVRRRWLAIALTILIEGLLVLALLNLGATPVIRRDSASRMTSFQLEPAAKEKESAPKAVAEKAETPVEKPVVVPPEKPLPPTANKGFVEMSREDFAAADIGKLPPAAAKAGSGGQGDSPLAGGNGPDGQPLYQAEWYREPRDGELAAYLPRNRPRTSWAIIACRTIADYHVDNCQALGESPPGSGLGSAMRQAAWQFRVRPPRVGNKPLIGAWVRIRFDFTTSAG